MTQFPAARSGLPTTTSTASFWHKEPSHILLGHRTTETIPERADIVVVGSGITGSFAAHYLLQDEDSQNLDLVMLEAREACWGATGRNGGHCQPKLFNKEPHISRFELSNFRTLSALISKNSIPCSWQLLSNCKGFLSEPMFAAAVSDIEAMRVQDPELGAMMKIVTSASDNPSLKDLRFGKDVVGGIVTENSASLWPYKLVAWLLEDLLKMRKGFNLQTNTPVTSIQQQEDGNWIIHTNRGMIVSKKVLLATNGYTSYLLPKFADLIVPVRGEMSSLLPPPSISPVTGMPLSGVHSYVFLGNSTQSSKQDDYLVQLPFVTTSSGELLFGGGRSHAASFGVGTSDDSVIDPLAAAYLRRELNVELDLENDGKELQASFEWSGIMGYSRDDKPWVGPVGPELGGGKGLWVCSGFTGHGMPNACLSAKGVAEMMLGKVAQEWAGKLPKEYEVTKERLVKARLYPEVKEADFMPDDYHC